MNFVHNGIIDGLFNGIIKNILYKVIAIVKSTTFKLKTINFNIYILKLFYNFNFKSIFNQTH
jgi:hypothetical protein